MDDYGIPFFTTNHLNVKATKRRKFHRSNEENRGTGASKFRSQNSLNGIIVSELSPVTRTPLQNITNTEKLLLPSEKHKKLVPPTVIDEISSNLFSSQQNVQSTSSHNFEDIDQSSIYGFDSTDDENDDELSENIYSNEASEGVNELDIQAGLRAHYASLGAPTVVCNFCNALMWKEERVNKTVIRGMPKFSLCCSKGQIKLKPVPPTPRYLKDLYYDKNKGSKFKNAIRQYNNILSFTSTGGKVDNSINNGSAPYIYRLNGQNHHLLGSLLPAVGEHPKFCQLYIYDTEHEVDNRMCWMNNKNNIAIDSDIVDGLVKMLDENNLLVKTFRMARDRFIEESIVDFKIILKASRSQSGRSNHMGPSDEVAAIMVGDLEETCGSRDVVIESKMEGLKRISDVHPLLMALQYPLLFPKGDDGYHENIFYVENEHSTSRKRRKVSMREYYAYVLQVRLNEGLTIRLGARLYQQFVVDAFSIIEQSRLWWFRCNQKLLRTELYSHMCDYLSRGDGDATNIGKGFILPAGFVGSKRYMQQNFQDALAICRFVGHPDIFLTMTSNPMWDEIIQMLELLPGCTPQNSPDIIARVFKLKLDQLVADIKKKSFFGKCFGVEFQKRGLPHVHMLIWLEGDAKKYLIDHVDQFVSAEIPNPTTDPMGYAAVRAYMMHGPCGKDNLNSPCIKNFKCIRHFPKKYCSRTMFDQSGFPLYQRRRTKITVNIRKSDLDNQWVVPYNRELLLKYQCHINIEICAQARSLKYLFKYCLKGHDRMTVEVRSQATHTQGGTNYGPTDEIQAYFDGRYICACEAAYLIFAYDIHYRSISVERLSFHLPGMKSVTFAEHDNLSDVLAKAHEKRSQLEAFFLLNTVDKNANAYTYDEIPMHYVWNDSNRVWTSRKKGFQIGRMCYTHHSTGELWYMRLLLSKIRGPTSFISLRTWNGVVYSTFQEACHSIGLLDDDNEWDAVLTECSRCGMPSQIRELFVHIIVNCKVADIKKLWNSHQIIMSEDILYKMRIRLQNPTLELSQEQIYFYTLAEIDKLLRSIGKSLRHYQQMPLIPDIYASSNNNNLILEESRYDRKQMADMHNTLFQSCNEDQRKVYDAVIHSVEKKEGKFFFVYGSGGCGKTYLWKTLLCRLRSEGRIVLPVASSGIAATLMEGGRTAHSRFKLPILLDDYSLCGIELNSDIAELIKQTDLIIWDEAPMQHRYAFECLDRSLKDIMKIVDARRSMMPFGGITVLLGGDFRQILPVITRGSRSDIVSSCITRSKLWYFCEIFVLRQNMRLHRGNTVEENRRIESFANWVLQIGDGNIPPIIDDQKNIIDDHISIPQRFCDVCSKSSLTNLIESTYPLLSENYKSGKYLSERAILTPTNETVGYLNSLIVDLIPGEPFTYCSADTAEEFGGTDSELQIAFPTEYLNSLQPSGIPTHNLILKEGVVVMLTRNLNQTLGLCNGTRMVVVKCFKHSVQCQVICGNSVGSKHFIPRMELSPSDSRLPFKFVRKQLPIQVCYAMTINKAQGQSLEYVGLYLPKPVFTHGQLYVAVSRVTQDEGLKVFIESDDGCCTTVTQNIVYKEVFYNVPVV